MGFPTFRWVLPGFTRFQWVLLGSTGFYWVSLEANGFSYVSLGFTGFYLFSLGFTGFYWVLLGFTGFCLNPMGFPTFHWVLPGFTCFQWISSLGFTGFSGFYWEFSLFLSLVSFSSSVLVGTRSLGVIFNWLVLRLSLEGSARYFGAAIRFVLPFFPLLWFNLSLSCSLSFLYLMVGQSSVAIFRWTQSNWFDFFGPDRVWTRPATRCWCCTSEWNSTSTAIFWSGETVFLSSLFPQQNIFFFSSIPTYRYISMHIYTCPPLAGRSDGRKKEIKIGKERKKERKKEKAPPRNVLTSGSGSFVAVPFFFLLKQNEITRPARLFLLIYFCCPISSLDYRLGFGRPSSRRYCLSWKENENVEVE